MIGLRLFDGLDCCPEVRPVVERNLVVIAQRLEFWTQSEGSSYVELVDRSAIVKQQQELNLLGAQIDDCGLDLRFVLNALKLDPGQVDLGEVAGIESHAADVDDFVVVIEIGLRQFKHRLGLKCLHKGRAQTEDQIAFQVNVLRLSYLRAFLGALKA